MGILYCYGVFKNQIKLHHDIWKKLRSHIVNLTTDFFFLSLIILVLRIINGWTDFLFSDTSMPIKILIYIYLTKKYFSNKKNNVIAKGQICLK
jgi:hypothetical protein